MTVWAPLRTRDLYRFHKNEVMDSLDSYWLAINDSNLTTKQVAASIEHMMLAAFRLLKYVRIEIAGLDYCINDNEIKDIYEGAMAFYCLSEGGSTSYQEESNVLEILSRAAYREMKELLNKKS